ncbi:TetR/AcrR family transcriptional regulator [Nocardia sp. NPDC055053]
METVTGGGSQPRRGTVLRRAEIARNASELFASRGFHAVRMDDIAQASGITARALYRHYANKQTLLAHVVLEDQQRVISTLAALDEQPPDTRTFDTSLAAITDAALDTGALSLLWQREARHLADDDYRRVRRQTRRMAERVENLLVSTGHAGLDPTVSDIRSWVVISLISGPSLYGSTLLRPRLAEEISAAVRRVIAAPLPIATAAVEDSAQRSPLSRREQLLSAAARAFRERGFGAVSMDDIGSQVGVVGPALYRYVDTKAELLAAVLGRLHEWLALELSRAMRTNCDDAEVLALIVRGYVRVALEATDLLAVWLTERLNLPEATREPLNRLEADYLAEWQRWLLAARPELTDARALALVKAGKTLVDDLVRIPHLRALPILPEELETAVFAVMDIAPR